MSIRAMNYVWEHSQAQGTARLCLLAIAKLADDNGECTPKIADLAQMCRVGERSIQRTLSDLKDAGHLRMQISAGLPSDKAVQILCAKEGQRFPYVPRYAVHPLECPWCKGETIILHAHHFPIPRSEGGTETIRICASCHAEYHALTNDQYTLVVNMQPDPDEDEASES